MSADLLIILVLDILIGGLFIIAAIGKVVRFRDLTQTIEAYALLPTLVIFPVSMLLIGCELFFGLLAVGGLAIGSQAGMFGLALMLAVYAIAIGINLMRGNADIDCGCAGFGQRQTSLNWGLVIRNMLLAIVALAAASLPVTSRVLNPIDWVSGLGALVSLPLFYVAAQQLLGLHLAKGSNQ